MSKKPKKHSEPKEHFLKMPNHILNLRIIGLPQKVLLSHIFSFGRKGCWQANATLAEMFLVGERTISEWVAKLKKAELILWVHPKGRYRTIWAKTHPDVKAAQTLLYMGEEVKKSDVVSGHAAILLGSNLPGGVEETCAPTTQNDCNQVGRNLLHTNNTTREDITRETTATPSPLPAGGQAPALLEDREAEALATIEDFKRSFGGGPRRGPKPTAAEKEKRRQEQLRALEASEAVRKTALLADPTGRKKLRKTKNFPRLYLNIFK